MFAVVSRPISPNKNKRLQNRKRREYAQFEALELRTLLSSTLFVTPGAPDVTHFQTLQAALSVAVTGDTIVLQPGFATGSFATTHLAQIANAGATSIHTAAALDVGDVITIGNNTFGDVAERNLVTAIAAGPTGDFIITLASPLTASHNGSIVDATNGTQGPTIGLSSGITLTAQAGAVLPFNLELWQGSPTITISQINMGAFALFVDGSGNTIGNSTLGNVVVLAGAQGNAFQGNTFNIASGNGPLFNHADNTIIDGNVFNVTSAAAIGLTVQNSAHVIITNNVITTATGGTGILVSVAGSQSTTVDIRDNVVNTTDGTGISLTKSGLGSTLQARLQGNDFRNNAMGVRITGDGVSAGKIDLGGGNTVLGSSTGHNNFSTFNSADAAHFAIGLFNTNVGALVRAAGNTFSTLNPLGVVADAFNTPAAGGSGVILATGGFSSDYIFANGAPDTITNAAFSGTLASFTCFLSHEASDFNVAINWGDGTASTGSVGGNDSGFTVSGNHTWAADGSYTVTVIIESIAGGTAVVFDAADIAQIFTRDITLQGTDIIANQFAAFTGTVASFTDNMADTTTSDYTATIAWSDGQVTPGTIVANIDGSFSIAANRSFNVAGSFTATINLSTTDGYNAAAGINVTVNPARALTLHGINIAGAQFQLFHGNVATFTDNLTGTFPSDYTASIAWSDGQTTSGTIVANATGGFSVSTSRVLTTAGNLTAIVTVTTTDNLVSSNVRLDVTVYPRLLTAQGINITALQFEPFTGTVATFTDSSPGAAASNYIATIAWSDGTSSPGTISANKDGSFSVSVSRTFNTAGNLTAVVNLSTSDHLVSSAAAFTATINPRVLTLQGKNISIVQGGTFTGTVASFTDNKAGTAASDYVATIAWSDGTTSPATIVANNDGSFSVKTSRSFLDDDNLTATVTLSAPGNKVTTTANVTAAVQQRQLTLDTIDINVKKSTTFNGVVATFTDNLPGTLASGYTASISWSDGTTSSATITRNTDGSFSISTNRSFSKTGTVTGTLNISTSDQLFTASANLTATVTNDNGKTPPGQCKHHRWFIHFCHIRHGKFGWDSCHH